MAPCSEFFSRTKNCCLWHWKPEVVAVDRYEVKFTLQKKFRASKEWQVPPLRPISTNYVTGRSIVDAVDYAFPNRTA